MHPRRHVRPVLVAVSAGKVQGHDAESVPGQVGNAGPRIAAERRCVVRANPALAVVWNLAGPRLDAARRQPFHPELVVEDGRDHLRGLLSDRRRAAEHPSLRLPGKANHVHVTARLRLRDVDLERDRLWKRASGVTGRIDAQDGHVEMGEIDGAIYRMGSGKGEPGYFVLGGWGRAVLADEVD